MSAVLPAPTTRIADDQAAHAESVVRELRSLLAASSSAGADDITRHSCGLLIEEAIAFLASCRRMLA